MTWKRKLLSTALIILLLIIAVGITGFFLLRSHSFHEWVLAKINQKASESLGGRVRIENFRLQLSTLTVDMFGITIHGTEAETAAPLLRVDQLALRLKIVSLFHEKIDLNEIIVRHPVVDLVMMKDGTTNLPHPANNTNSSTNVFDLGIQHVLLTNGEVYYNDRKMRLDAELHDLEIEIRSQQASNHYSGSLSYRDGRLKYGTYRPLPHDLLAKFTASPSDISLNPLVLRVESSVIQLDGKVRDFANPSAEGNYRIVLHPQDFRALLSNPTIPAGEIILAGSIGARQLPNTPLVRTLVMDGRLSSRELLVENPDLKTAIRNLRGEFRLANGNLSARGIEAELIGGRLKAEATMLHLDTKPVSTVHASLEAVSLDAAKRALRTSKLAQVPISGQIHGTAVAAWEGTIENLKVGSDLVLNASLASAAAGAHPVPLQGAIHATYDRAADLATLTNTFVGTPSTRIDLNGTAGQRLNLTVRAHAADLRELDSVARAFASSAAQAASKTASAASSNLAGAAHAELLVQGTKNDPEIRGQVSGRNLEFENTQWRTLQLGFQASKSLISVENGSIVNAHQGYLVFAFSAGLSNWHYLPASPMEVQLRSRGISLSQLLRAAKKEYQVSGNLSSDVYLHGSELNPVGNGSLKLAQAEVYGQRFENLSLEFTGNGNAVNSTLLAVMPAGSAKANVVLYPKTKAYELQLNVAGINLSKLQAVKERNLEVTGLLSASAVGRGTFENPQINATLQIPRLQIRQANVAGIKAQLNVADHNAQFALDSDLAQSSIQARADVNLTDGYFTRATLDTKQIPLEGLLALARPVKTNGPHGFVELHASLTGPIQYRDRLQAQVIIPTLSASYQGLMIANRGPIRAHYANSVVVVDPSEIEGTDTTLRVEGQLPLKGNAPLTLAVNGAINMQLVRFFAPDIESSGRMAIHAHASGALPHPMLAGQIQIQQVSLVSPSAPLGLENLNGVLDIRNNQLILTELRGQVGGGQVSATGVVSYSPQLQMNVSLRAESVRILYQDSLRMVLDSNLDLVGNSQSSVLSGRVLVDNLGFIHKNLDITTLAGQFQTGSQTAAPTEGLASHMKLNIALQSSNQLSLATTEVSLEGQVNLRLIGTAADPVIVGRANFTGGDIYLMNRRYEIKRALIQFLNPNRTEPVVNVLITTTVSQYDLSLNFIGPIDKMRTNYTSNPPLPAADIINLVARGQTQEQAQATPSNFGAQSLLSQAAASRVSSGVQKLAGLSSFSLDPTLGGNDANPGARVALQKRVSNKLLFTFASDVTSAQREIIQGQYQFNKRWSATVTRDENGGVAVDGKFRTSF